MLNFFPALRQIPFPEWQGKWPLGFWEYKSSKAYDYSQIVAELEVGLWRFGLSIKHRAIRARSLPGVSSWHRPWRRKMEHMPVWCPGFLIPTNKLRLVIGRLAEGTAGIANRYAAGRVRSTVLGFG